MSHYCCKTCGQRYNECKCPSLKLDEAPGKDLEKNLFDKFYKLAAKKKTSKQTFSP